MSLLRAVGKLGCWQQSHILILEKRNMTTIEDALLIRVVDGDTIEVWNRNREQRERVRVIGIDAPEEGQKFYREAKEVLEEILSHVFYVVLVFEGPKRDKFDRLRAHVYLPTTSYDPKMSVSEMLLESGYAKAKTVYPHRRARRFWGLEQQAKRKKRGIWHRR